MSAEQRRALRRQRLLAAGDSRLARLEQAKRVDPSDPCDSHIPAPAAASTSTSTAASPPAETPATMSEGTRTAQAAPSATRSEDDKSVAEMQAAMATLLGGEDTAAPAVPPLLPAQLGAVDQLLSVTGALAAPSHPAASWHAWAVITCALTAGIGGASVAVSLLAEIVLLLSFVQVVGRRACPAVQEQRLTTAKLTPFPSQSGCLALFLALCLAAYIPVLQSETSGVKVGDGLVAIHLWDIGTERNGCSCDAARHVIPFACMRPDPLPFHCLPTACHHAYQQSGP